MTQKYISKKRKDPKLLFRDSSNLNWNRIILIAILFFILFFHSTQNAFGCFGSPSISISVDDATPCVNDTVTFTATYSNVSTGTWNFGNSAIPATVTDDYNVDVHYTTAGSKTITCVVQNFWGTQRTATMNITVNPVPTVTSSTTGTICSGVSQNYDITGSVSGTTFSWSRAAVIGISNGALSGQTTDPITEALINTTSSPLNVVYQITPSANGCVGTSTNYTVTVYPTPTVTTESDQYHCNGASVPINSLAGPVTGTTFSWTNSNTSIGLAASGNGDIPAFTATNSGNSDLSATITITPSANGCAGTASTYSITVYPTVGTPTAITISAGTEPTCQLTNGTTTTTYATTATNNTGLNWSLSNGAAGSIDAATGVMTWANGFSGSVDIRVTASGCNGPSAQVIRTVNITPTVGTPTAITISAGTEPSCQLTNGTTTTTYATTATDNTGFNWSLSNPAAGSIGASTGVMTWANGFSGSVDIRVTASGCNGPSAQVIRTVTVVAQPTAPTITRNPDVNNVCAGQTLTITTSAGSGGTGNIADEYRYSTDNGNNWSAWSTSVPSFAAVVGTNIIQSRRTADGTGCNTSASNQVSWNVVAQPTAPTITRNPDVNNVCAGQTLTITTSPGSGGTGNIADEYRYSTDNGNNWSAWSTSVPNFAAVVGTNIIQSRRTADGMGCNTSSPNQVSWNINSPTVTISTDYVEDCPELDPAQGFNPQSGNYDAGSTKLVFEVSLSGTTSAIWSFDYAISGTGVSVRTSGVPSPNYPQNGSISDTTSNPVVLTFYINNIPPVELYPSLTISNITDANGCSATNVSSSVTIKAMPDVGDYE